MTDHRSYNELSAEYDAEHVGKEYPLPPFAPPGQKIMDDGRFFLIAWCGSKGETRHTIFDREKPRRCYRVVPDPDLGWTPRAYFFGVRKAILNDN